MYQIIMVAFSDYHNIMYELHISREDLSGLFGDNLALSLHGREGPRNLFFGEVIGIKELFEFRSPQGVLEELTKSFSGEILENDEGAHFVRYWNYDIERAEAMIIQYEFFRLSED